MTTLTARIDALMGKLGYLIAGRPKSYILAILIIVGLIASNLPKTTIDTSTESFLFEDSISRLDYNDFRDQFGRDEKVIVAIEADDVFTQENLEKINQLHIELEKNVPHLNDITSIINARNTVGTEDSLLVGDLFEEWPENEGELAKLRDIAVNNPIYQNLLISEDGKFTVMVLESNTYTSVDKGSLNQDVNEMDFLEDELGGFDELDGSFEDDQYRDFISDEENTEMVLATTEIVDKYRSENFKIHIAGSSAFTAILKQTMMHDMVMFIAMMLLTIVIFLAILFRRPTGVVLPILTVILAVISTMGLMALFGTPITLMTQILPSFLLAVGIGASVHILTIFYKHYDQNDNKADAISYTLEHSGFAVVMTSLTTAAGMASFYSSEVAPVADLGIFSAAGVLISLLFTLILLPALLIVFPIKHRPSKRADKHHDFMDEVLTSIANFSVDHAKKIVVISLLFMAITISFASQIRYSHNPMAWFPEDNISRIATELIDDKMRGTISLELVIDTGKENGLYDIELLKSIESLSQYAETITSDTYFVGKVVSIVDMLKEIHKALNENRPEYYRLADNVDLIAQEILLFENSGSDDLEDLVDSQFSKARVTLKLPWIESFQYRGLLSDIQMKLDSEFDDSVNITTTGMVPLLAQTATSAVESSGKSYLIAFGVITIMMIILLSNVKIGLISMIPNLFPIFFVLATMVIFDLPLDLFSMLIGAIIIGIAVDDTVHFMHNFKNYQSKGLATREAVIATLTSTGRAMVITTIVLSIGFVLYVFSELNNLFLFGMLTSVAFIVALLADLLLAPALMALIFPTQNTKA